MRQEIHVPDNISLHELMNKQHGLFGEVTIHRRNKQTGEVAFWYQDHNIIPISGMQWILMKMFGLYLDAPHKSTYENLGKDTTLVIPELNQSGIMGIGTLPTQYTPMEENIASNHIVQGFMVGNGGAGEDQLTAKNTDYSFINLRNPIPFQQSQEQLPPEVAAKYLGKLQVPSGSSYANSYYIKKFDTTPHIYHSWWKDGQKWDYVDPVVPSDLGPNAANGVGKTNRIESYVECKLTIDESDFKAYFTNDGNTQTPAINELGLVAFDSTPTGDYVILEKLYLSSIKPVVETVFRNDIASMTPEQAKQLALYISNLSLNAYEVTYRYSEKYNNNQLNLLSVVMNTIYSWISTREHIDPTYFSELLMQQRDTLSSSDTISVVALYDQNRVFQSETDQYLNIISDIEYTDTVVDEAQRIKLITYYTFKSIPIEENWETVINYRIYAN